VLFYAKYANFYVTQQKSPDETTLLLLFRASSLYLIFFRTA